MFSCDGGAWRSTDRRALALEEWREAAGLVPARWALFSKARREARGPTFAFYVAARDAEEVAAAAVVRPLIRPTA